MPHGPTPSASAARVRPAPRTARGSLPGPPARPWCSEAPVPNSTGLPLRIFGVNDALVIETRQFSQPPGRDMVFIGAPAQPGGRVLVKVLSQLIAPGRKQAAPAGSRDSRAAGARKLRESVIAGPTPVRTASLNGWPQHAVELNALAVGSGQPGRIPAAPPAADLIAQRGLHQLRFTSSGLPETRWSGFPAMRAGSQAGPHGFPLEERRRCP